MSEIGRLSIRDVREADVPACARIEALCFPPEESASEEKIRKRAQIYPEGFLVAEPDGDVVGFINSWRYREERPLGRGAQGHGGA